MIEMKIVMIWKNMVNGYQHDDIDNNANSDDDNKNGCHNDSLHGSKVGDGWC